MQLRKNKYFLVKKLEIQIFVYIIMLTRSSERIFKLMRYTGMYNRKLKEIKFYNDGINFFCKFENRNKFCTLLDGFWICY